MAFLKIAQTIFVVFAALAAGLIYGGFARKIKARIQNRYGPPFYQNVTDLIKLLGKRNEASHGIVFNTGPVFSAAAAASALMFIPIGHWKPLFSFEGDIFVLFYLLAAVPLGAALGAGASANPLAAAGIVRGLVLMLGYEAVLFVSLLAPMAAFKTASLYKIILIQQSRGWNFFPFVFSSLAALISLMGMLGMKPFDIVSAPAEIASGPAVEYGGRFLALLGISGAIGIISATGIFADVFLGGGGLVSFIAKTFVLFIALVAFSEAFPRFRPGEAFAFYWKYPLLIALLGLLISVLRTGK